MKKLLLGTSAIVLAGASAGSTHAAEWDVRVGGYYNAMVAYGSTDLPTGDTRDFDGVDVSTNSEVFFLPSITLDNGIKIGANMQLEGDSQSCSSTPCTPDTIDESFVYIDGSFGRILIGSENSAGYLMHYAAPNAAIIPYNSPSTGDYIAWSSGVDSVFRGTLGATSLEVERNNDSKRITYFTPRFSGFQIGLSYAHDGNQDNFGPTDISNSLAHIFDIGANYVQSYGDLNVAVSARWGTAENGSANPTIWGAGINIGYGGFTVGGSFAESNEHNAGNGAGADDGTAFDLGVSYNNGPMTYSLTWFRGENGNGGGLKDEQNTIGAGIDYKMAAGVRLNIFGAVVGIEKPGPRNDIDGFVLGTGIGLSW